jgi:hypothetical protein
VNDNIDKFIDELKTSLSAGTFVKMTLGNYKGSEAHLQKIFVRQVDTKKGSRLLFQFRYESRDVVKNLDLAEAVRSVQKHLESGFRSGHLFTTTSDTQLEIGKRNSRLSAGKPTFATLPSNEHDRKKKMLIDPNAFYLKALGIATDAGEIRASEQDKWRQINKFVEILSGLVDKSSLKNKNSLRIVDMGSGKGYLTFAAYDYLQKPAREQGRNLDIEHLHGPPTRRIEMTGVELRPELVSLCNDIAKAGSFDGLNFVEGTIADFDPGEVDILIALHACDTATDDALFKGITAKAEIIVAAPCCHKEIRPQIKPPEMFAGILKHGIVLERTAETITDGLRSLLLERSGYATKLFEFIATEHTPKNNMLVGTRKINKMSQQTDQQIQAITDLFGIKSQRLSTLLKF